MLVLHLVRAAPGGAEGPTCTTSKPSACTTMSHPSNGVACTMSSNAITGVVDRLERIGLARREHDPDDRRKTLVRVLPAVLQRVMPLFEPMERSAMAVLSNYSDDELALLLDFLTRA
jgi:MarR family protein